MWIFIISLSQFCTPGAVFFCGGPTLDWRLSGGGLRLDAQIKIEGMPLCELDG